MNDSPDRHEAEVKYAAAAEWAEHEMTLKPNSTTALHGDEAAAFGRELVERATTERWLDQLDPADVQVRDAGPMRAVIAAAEDLSAAEDNLRRAVAAARAAGDSWTVIGAALSTTPQTTLSRFGDRP
jgi:hypothetical protein